MSIAVSLERGARLKGIRGKATPAVALFGAASAAKGAMWAVTDLLLGAMLRNLTSLSGHVIAVILAALLLAGALSDLAVGQILVRSRLTAVSMARFQFAGAIAAATLLLLQFVIPVLLPVRLLTVAFLFRFAYAVYDVALSTLTSLLPRSAVERARYVRVRVLAGATSRLVVTVLNATIIAWASSASTAGSWALTILSGIVVLSSAGLLIVVSRTGELPVVHVPPTHARPKGEGAFWLLLCAFFIATSGLPTLSRLLVFVDADVQGQRGPTLLLAFVVGSVIAPLASRSRFLAFDSGRPTKVVLLASALSAPALAAILLSFDMVASAAAATIHGTALGFVTLALWDRAAELAAARSARGGRTDSVVFGAVIACIQFAIATGTLCLAPFIDAVARSEEAALFVASALSCGSALVLWPVLSACDRARAAALMDAAG